MRPYAYEDEIAMPIIITDVSGLRILGKKQVANQDALHSLFRALDKAREKNYGANWRNLDWYGLPLA